MWIRFLLAIVFALFLTENTSAAVISEVLPNTENDTLLESITLKNNSCVPEDISLYSLTDASGKVFIIPSGTILSSFSEQKFFRPETKITLNNENESLFLRNTSGTLLDSFSYVTSLKNIAIFHTVSNEMCSPVSENGSGSGASSGSGAVASGSGTTDPAASDDSDTSANSTEYTDPVEWNITPEITGSGGQIEDENLVSSGSFGEPGSFSGTLSDSGSSDSNSGSEISSWATSSGSTSDTNTGTTLSGAISTISGVLAHIHVQSGLDGDLRCYKEDCSVNFEFPSPKSTDSCTWNFGGGTSSAEDVSKCNPSYVHYGYGTYQVRLRVCHALGNCSEDSIVLYVIDPESSSSTSVSSSTTTSTTSSATTQATTSSSSVTSSGITTSSTGTKVLINPGHTPPRIVFSPDAKGEVDSQGNIIALCDKTSKKVCQISITPLIFEEDSWKEWSFRWILPNSSKRYTKVLKGILPTLKEEIYIFEMFSKENSKSFRFSIKVRKHLVEAETFEGQSDEVVVAASGDTQKVKAKTTPKTTKTTKASTKTTAAKTTKTSSGPPANTASKAKTSSLETGTKSTEDNNIKVLLLFAASILSFGLGLSISRLFLPERGKWISSGNSDEDS